jgi:uncharacterized cupredoxin-like copper-binding protein
MSGRVTPLRLTTATVVLLLASVAPARLQPATVDWSHAQPINVLMVENSFIPERLTFRHGMPYQLHLENHGKELHEFTAPAFLAAAIVRDPRMLSNGGQEIVLQPGTSVDVDLVPLKPGAYNLTCADHDWDGMTGEIIVE